MAKAIATVGGIAIAPGVSKNRRLYTPEMIARAVDRAQKRIAAGAAIPLTERDDVTHPLTTLTHHGGEGDTTRITGGVTSLTLDDTGKARFKADVVDTPHGRTIATLVDNTNGPAFLKGVSIRGHWIGKVKRVPGPDGQPVETADDLEIDGLDYTPNPGVNAAGIDTFSWAGDGKRAAETTERVLIFESVEEAHVTISETVEPDGDTSPVGEAQDPPGDVLGLAAHVFEDGMCVTCERAATLEAARPMSKRGSGISGAGGPYADPGYQADKKQRYQLDTKAHARAAWSYVNMPKNAKDYSAAQLKRVKARIMKALRRFGVKVTSEGWVLDSAVQITEAIAEHYGDPALCGSWSINASNGPISLCLSSYSMDPADLDVILRTAADAACVALQQLDPDMDGDVDVPGASDDADPDDDAGDLSVPPLTLTGDESAESVEPDPADPAESAVPPAPEPAAGETTEGDSPMESTTAAAESTPAAGAPVAAGLTQADILAAIEADRNARKAAKRAAKARAAESVAARESENKRIAKLVEERVAAAIGTPATPAAPAEGVQETEDQKVARLVEERLVEERQRLVATGQVSVGRTGLVTPISEAAAALGGGGGLNEFGVPDNWPNKPLHEYTSDERDRFMGPALVGHVLGARVQQLS